MAVLLDFDSKTLARLCRKHGVRLLVLHGSCVSGRANEQSDIDVGMMMSRKIGDKAYLNIISDFGGIFGDKFDPVILNGAEPLISRELAERLKGSGGMRNIIVHEYMDIDDRKVYGSLKQAISGFKEYIAQVDAFLEKKSL